MTKKILSLLLCVMMLAGLCVVSASAEAPTRVLNDFDGNGEIQLLGPNNQGFTGALSEVDYTTIDPTYTDGKVMQIYIKDAVNYGGWCFNLDQGWASDDYDLPVTLKFQIWSDTAGVHLWRSSGLSKDSWASWNPSDVKTTFQQLGMADMELSTEPTWITIDLTKVAVPYTSRLGMRLNLDNTPSKVFLDNFILEYEENADKKASFDVEGIEDISANASGYVTLPEAEISGKQFIGWIDDEGNVLKAGAQVRLKKSTAYTALSSVVDIQTGAGIRWAEQETERGMRFETYVSKDALDTLGSSKFEVGSLILPYADYNADITAENYADYGAVNVVNPRVYGEVGENYRYYTGIVDFEKYFAVSQAALADLKMTAVSYLKVTYSDGKSAYFYDHPDAVNNVRTVAEVARAALADTDFGYTEDQIKILNLYNQYSEQTNVPSYRTDAKDNPNALAEVHYVLTDCATQGNGFSTYVESGGNGPAINQYTPEAPVTLYNTSSFTVGSTFKITLPESVAGGNYIINFNTRGYSSRGSCKISVSSAAGDFVAGESVNFKKMDCPEGVGLWHNVAAPNAVKISGDTTITLTSTVQGSLYLYDVTLTPVY